MMSCGKKQDAKQQDFLSFVLDHYISQGWGELDQAKLPRLLELKYDTIRDAISELEGIEQIQNALSDFRSISICR